MGEKTDAVETLHAEIDQLEASISKLTEDITELTKAVADLDAAMAKATEIRQEEKTENTATIKDAGEAQTAVAQALTVLKEFLGWQIVGIVVIVAWTAIMSGV